MTKQARTQRNSPSDIHIVLAAKGGIGKTYIASLLAQYAVHSGVAVKVFDLDQSNTMLARVPSLKAEAIGLLSDAKFDNGKMDQLIKRIASEAGPFILDVGASTFQDVWRYFTKYKMIAALEGQGRRVIFHSVIVAGPELPDVLNSFSEVANSVDGRQLVVWLNPIHGPVHANGKGFLEMAIYATHRHKVLAVIELPQADGSTVGDLQTLALNLHTLSTIDQCDALEFFSKHRLTVHREELFSQIGSVWEAIHREAVEVA